MPTRCLVVDDVHPLLIHRLEAEGVEVVCQSSNFGRAEALEMIGEFDGVVVRSKLRLDKEFFQHARRLKFIARAGAGLDGIDMKQALERGVQIFNAPEGNRDAVAEHTIGLMLCLLNRIVFGHGEVKDGRWLREKNRGYELGSCTVGLIGYGNMGRAVAKRLQCFGCRVLAYDKYIGDKDWPDTNAAPVTMQQIKDEADMVSMHVPLTVETRGMADAKFLRGFARPIWLINTARGELVHNIDLLYHLRNGMVKGAALDVLENEKLDAMMTIDQVVFQALAASEKVIFTPHVAGWTHESYIKISNVLAGKIIGFLSNTTAGSAVNRVYRR